LISQNRKTILSYIGIQLPDSLNLSAPGSLFKIKDDIKLFDTATMISNDNNNNKNEINNNTSNNNNNNTEIKLMYDGKIIFDPIRVLESIKKWVKSGNAEASCCMLCFNDYSKSLLYSVCGNTNCNNLVCMKCLTAWYGSLQPGQIILPPRLSCPFCKRAPSGRVLRLANREACMLIKAVKLFDPNWYYAWCLKCYKPKEYLAHECSRDIPGNIKDGFTCSECAAKKPKEKKEHGEGIDGDSIKCPSCKAPVFKDGGCDHIACVCGIHWCYHCGVEFDYDNIYEHIYSIEY